MLLQLKGAWRGRQHYEPVRRPTDMDTHTVIEHFVLGYVRALIERKDPFSAHMMHHPSMSLPALKTVKHAKRHAWVWRAVAWIYKLLCTRRQATKRDLYYADPPLFGTQKNSDEVIELLSTKLLCQPRSALRVTCASRGKIWGALQYRENGASVDCMSLQANGSSISGWPNEWSNLHGKARLILVVEKDCAFQRVLKDQLLSEKLKTPLLLLSGCGYPDLPTRFALRRIAAELQVVCIC